MRYALLEYSRIPLPPYLTYQQTAAQHSLDVWTCGLTCCSAALDSLLSLPARIECMAKYVTVGRSIFVSCAMQATRLSRIAAVCLGLPGKPAGVAACRLGCLDR